VAIDQEYVSHKEANRLLESFKRLSVMISNLIDYLKRSGFKGEKFKNDSKRFRSGGSKNQRTKTVQAFEGAE
jgi:hypothetical protein